MQRSKFAREEQYHGKHTLALIGYGKYVGSMTNASILIVDDDRELGEMLREYLHSSNFQVTIAIDGLEAIRRIEIERFDLIILDVMLPSLNGFDVLKHLREMVTTPVIMLTAQGEDIDCVLGLELGADDYLSKPFNPRQLVARMRAVLRRVTMTPGDAGKPITIGELMLNPAAFTVTLHGELLTLTGTEFRLLETLMGSAGQMQTREHLTERVLGRTLSPYDRSIDTHVSNLRRKLSTSGGRPVEIRSVRSAGYVLIAGGGSRL